MSTLRHPVRIGLALLMAVAGTAHFASPRPFIDHLPAAVPLRAELVAVTGAIEIGLAVALVGPKRWREHAGLALAAYLVLVFPANVYAALSQVPIEGVPAGWLRWARLPLQVPLIVAAVWSTRAR
jgi:uncharacterized membrane protein